MLLSLIKGSKLFILVYIVLFTWSAFCSEETGIMVEKRLNPVTYFVDRTEQTKDIGQNLISHRIVSLIGVTNIGKTEIARQYALQNRERYELIWFFDSNLDLNEQFVLLAKKINETLLSKSQNKVSEEAEKAQKETMNFLTERKNWLLVFDNLKLNQNQKLYPIINWNNNGHIIICAQDSSSLPNNIYVHQLDKENAMKLLQEILGNDKVNQALLGKLVDIFKGYPGPIVQGALLLKEHKYLSIDEYKNILTKSTNPVKKHMELLLNLLNDNDEKLLRTVALVNNQNFSKNLLKIIFDNDNNIGEGLYNLTQFGLVKNTENIDNTNLFEMHDAIKEGFLELLTEEQIKDEITNIISKLNLLMQQGVASRYAFITSDITIKANLEILLNNAEKYNVDLFKILELRKNLIDYYLVSLDYYNVEKMKKWLEEKEADKSLVSNKMNDQQRINYSWYLADIGIYEHFAKSSFISSLSYLDKAKNIIQGITTKPELEFTILMQLAQTKIYGGDILGAEKNIIEVDSVIQKNLNADFDMGLYWFIKTRILMAKGRYEEAISAVDNNIKAEAHLPRDTFTAPTYILKSEILNYMGNFKDSYEIITMIQRQEISNNQPDHEIHGRILTQLSRAELGLELLNEALEHAVTACNIFQKEIIKYNITSVMNPEFAAALVAKGDVLLKKST